jgi:hypothetical protein
VHALSAHHKAAGDRVEFRRAGNHQALERDIWDEEPDVVYASLIFTETRPLAERLRRLYPSAILGGTGWDLGKPPRDRSTLERLGVGRALDYALYPSVTYSMGFTQRGCRKRCSFCDVWKAEPELVSVATVADIWRGEPWPRRLLLLDNDAFGNPDWETRFEEIRSGGFRVCFNQGINAREIGPREAEALRSVDYRADDFETKRLYCAWDNRADGPTLFRGLST